MLIPELASSVSPSWPRHSVSAFMSTELAGSPPQLPGFCFYIRAGDPNPGPHTRTASILSIDFHPKSNGRPLKGVEEETDPDVTSD